MLVTACVACRPAGPVTWLFRSEIFPVIVGDSLLVSVPMLYPTGRMVVGFWHVADGPPRPRRVPTVVMEMR